MDDLSATRPLRGQLVVVGIFALGVAFGFALSYVILHHYILPERMGRPRGGPVPIERMTRELDLDVDQQEKVRAILEHGHARMGAMLEETGREIRSVLRPPQQEKFDRMRPRSPLGHGPHDAGPPGEPPH